LFLDDSDIRSVGEKFKRTLDALGKISVKAHLVKMGKMVSPPSLRRLDIAQMATIPEKALKGKALSHQIRYICHPSF
jgi:hypothetical protein